MYNAKRTQGTETKLLCYSKKSTWWLDGLMSPGLTGVVLPAYIHTVEDGSGSPKNASNTTEVRPKPQERAGEDFTQFDS